MKKTTLSILITILLLMAVVLPASAITDGELDGEGHPHVGLMVAQTAEGGLLWRCSGTLISPTVFITAGHCTEEPAAHVELWFDNDLHDEIGSIICPAGETDDCYPYEGEYSGTPHTNPDYDPYAFYTNDLGIVVLDGEGVDLDYYGTLPAVGQFDGKDLKKGTNGTRFTAVGYGLQEAFPNAADWKTVAFKTRMVAYPFLLNINAPGMTGDFSMLLSNNHVTGGTCFGDSGGPNFLDDSYVIAGVTSFGMNPRCAGTGGVYRLDREIDRDWINDFLSE